MMLTSVGRWPALAGGGAADGLELADEIVDGLLGLVALIVEADLVAHGMIAEDHLQLLPVLFDAPRPVEHLGIADEALPVARDPAVGRAGENLLVGGDPLDAGLGDRAESSPGRPNLPRATCPAACCRTACVVILDGPANLRLGVFGDSLPDARGNLTSGMACRASRLSHSSGRIG